MQVIIDPTHLNPLLMMWGSTLRYVRAINVMAQYFCKAHNSNPITPELVSMTKSGTLTNAPSLGGFTIEP